jgi:proteasome accessory factor C
MVEVELGEASPQLLADVRRAAADHHQVDVEYYSYGRDEWTRRTIDPHRVFASAGQWYVAAWCHRVEDDRLFRIDRMRSAAVLDATFDPRPEPPAAVVFSPRPEDPVVTLDLAPSARWVLETYPYESVKEMAKGRARVQLRVSEQGWLERLLLRLGPEAKVVRGDSDVAADAARRLLGRYAIPDPVT